MTTLFQPVDEEILKRSTSKWKRYYEHTVDGAPHYMVERAISLFATERDDLKELAALDLGCGAGRDTVELARHGFLVYALDCEDLALEMTRTSALDAGVETVIALEADFLTLAEFPSADLIVSSFALPHCSPTVFPEVWQRVLKALNPGGRIAFHAYGPKDSWATRSNMTILTRPQLLDYLIDLDIEMLDEEETDAITPQEEAKHWHIFHVIAKSREPIIDS